MLWWLSFSGGKNLGVAIVEALSFGEAVSKSHLLGINPGGEVVGVELDTDDAIDEARMLGLHRLISRDELLGRGYKSTVELGLDVDIDATSDDECNGVPSGEEEQNT
jgi:hypothetical protein